MRMFIDSNDIGNREICSDVCIIGAGVAGITIAREFRDSGTDVVVLESGNFDSESKVNSLNLGENIGLPYYDLPKARTRAFGGSSHDWHINPNGGADGGFVRLRGLDAIDFEKRDWVPYSGWPFSKSDLDPYYIKAHKVCKIGPYRYEADFWDRKDTHPKLNFKEEAVRTTTFQFGKKDVFLKDYKEELAEASNIKIYLNATALDIEIGEYAKRINSVTATTLGGKKFHVKSSVFILAMGGLENPRLLLLSNKRVKKGIGNQNDLVGRFFMEHPHLWSGVFYPSEESFFGKSGLYSIHAQGNLTIMGKLVLSDEIMREEKILNNTASLHLSPRQALRRAGRAIHEIKQSIKQKRFDNTAFPNLIKIIGNPDILFNKAVRKLSGVDWVEKCSKENKYSGFLLNTMSEQSPDPESRVTLSREKDRLGQNRIRLNWKMNSSDIRSIRRYEEILDRELRKSSLGHLDIELKNDAIPQKIHGGYHHMGTTRMAANPKEGVVDGNCKVHGIDNLFIAGSSVFPTAGYANPTLTIVALAIRLADYLKNKSHKYSSAYQTMNIHN